MYSNKDWDVSHIASQLRSMVRECTDLSTSDKDSWNIKQDLFLLKELIEQSLKKCPEFGEIENDWLKKREQKRIINLLKD